MSTVEVITFTASRALVADGEFMADAIDYLRRVEGCERIFRGYAIEEKNKMYILITWSSNDTYNTTRKTSDAYNHFLSSVTRLSESHTISQWHVDFDVDAEGAFSAPVTEFAILTRKDGLSTINQVVSSMNKIQNITSMYPVMHDLLPIGRLNEKVMAGSILVCVGWDSVEAHLTAAKTLPLGDLIQETLAIADIKMTHVELRSC